LLARAIAILSALTVLKKFNIGPKYSDSLSL
jgi:hypothetical protein